MNNEDVIREYVDDTELFLLRGANTDPRVVAVRAALDALVAERDELKNLVSESDNGWGHAKRELDRVVAERDEALRAAKKYEGAMNAQLGLRSAAEARVKELEAEVENALTYQELHDEAQVRGNVAEARVAELERRLRDAPLGGDGSHWAGCWRSHIDCAAVRVAELEKALRVFAGINVPSRRKWFGGTDPDIVREAFAVVDALAKEDTDE